MTDRRTYDGRTAAAGTALGFLRRTDRPTTRSSLPQRTSGDGAQQITDAFDAVAARLLDLSTSLREQAKDEQADIMEVNCYIAQDPDLRVKRANDGQPVAVAVRQAIDAYAGIIAALDDPTLADRAADVRQVGRRVLAHLYGDPGPAPDQPLVLVAQEIGAADLLEPGQTVTGAISVTGGPNSHAAIVARSQDIPLLLGVDPQLLELPDGQEILLDTDRATAVVHPDDDERATALDAIDAARIRRRALAEERHLPARTLDEHDVVLRANVATPAEARAVLTAGADGVGLLRTELPFLNHAAWPTRNQHAAALVPVLRTLHGQTVTARTLDFADDKLPPFLAQGREGERLGRGLPLMLAQPDAFANQFRSLLSAGADTDLRIMIPMVARSMNCAPAAPFSIPRPPNSTSAHPRWASWSNCPKPSPRLMHSPAKRPSSPSAATTSPARSWVSTDAIPPPPRPWPHTRLYCARSPRSSPPRTVTTVRSPSAVTPRRTPSSPLCSSASAATPSL
ncbi:phosphoenolpyruvate-protein kinase (PTS system EI component) [Streptomyces sp. V4I23]|nr:putative PEP-binding protein [Streptomyces sp. V4I23]MDQ1006883.1 phosphoenolpyruvate-protein kinase (PTS system EI component) [Streptomyces sp. V4I23]